MPTSYSLRTPDSGPNIAVRADFMGVATVNKLSSTKALLVNETDQSILVTSKDTFNDPTLDLQEKLKNDLRVAYKAQRITAIYNAVAVYVRPLSQCLMGDASVTEIRQTLGYATSTKYGGIFFPANAVKESIINEKHRDLTKWIRPDDPIAFVAVKDKSTENRCSYAVDVRFAFNRDVRKPMIGIITYVDPVSCKVWAKNFPTLRLKASDFGIDPATDLQENFTPGDRILFHAEQFGSSKVTSVRSADRGRLEKFQTALPERWDEEIASSLSYDDRNDEPSDIGALDLIQREQVAEYLRYQTPSHDEQPTVWDIGFGVQEPSAIPVSVKARAGISSRDKPITANADENALMRMLEDELADLELEDREDIVDDQNADQFDSPPNNGTSHAHASDCTNGEDYPNTSDATKFDFTNSTDRKDAEVQVNTMLEPEIVKEWLDDKEIFAMVCQRFPDLLRAVMQARHGF